MTNGNFLQNHYVGNTSYISGMRILLFVLSTTVIA